MGVANKWAHCLKIVRQDGVTIGLTELDKDIVFESVTYLSAAGYTGTETQTTADLSVNNADVEGVLTAIGVDRDDIVAGLYDKASLSVFIYDWENETKVRDLAAGSWGETALIDGRYKAEFRSLTQTLQQTIGRVHSPECDAVLGDSRCKLSLASLTVSSSVSSVTDNRQFIASGLIGTQSDAYYAYGNLTFTSGLNNNIPREVKSYNDATGELVLALPMPYAINSSDTFDVSAGCDKAHATCRDKFNNVPNFRGDPFMMGQDELIKAGGQ